ncbi:hypothetical protein [Sphingobium sp.]|uniref:hypothetical protein n=1 Tax=Sphingobium sp. TaxID=1912891 RepID=UPI002BB40267|nr:hypothetical protein [Sphingobium sp.]HUD94091.1 hypothetical protein [Sphingobium sp.]
MAINASDGELPVLERSFTKTPADIGNGYAPMASGSDYCNPQVLAGKINPPSTLSPQLTPSPFGPASLKAKSTS